MALIAWNYKKASHLLSAKEQNERISLNGSCQNLKNVSGEEVFQFQN